LRSRTISLGRYTTSSHNGERAQCGRGVRALLPRDFPFRFGASLKTVSVSQRVRFGTKKQRFHSGCHLAVLTRYLSKCLPVLGGWSATRPQFAVFRSSARFQFCRLRRRRSVGHSRDSAPSSGRKHGREETDSAQVRLPLPYTTDACPTQVVGRELSLPIFFANSFTTYQTSFSLIPSPHALPALLTFRKSFPVLIPAASTQSRATL
jgi:hypothetical protein